MYNRDWDDMWDLLDSGEKPPFSIEDDNKADWALEQVLAQYQERDRLCAIAKARISEIQEQMREMEQRYQARTAYLTGHLRDYFDRVTPSSVTKTQTKYKLFRGELVLKKQQPEYVRDEQAMVAWAKASAPEYIKTTESINWGELKKATVLQGEEVLLDGEIIPGIVAKAREDVFEVKA